MRKTKSLDDLNRQWERLNSDYRLDDARSRRVNDIVARYTRNMMGTRQFSRDDLNQTKAFRSGNRATIQAAKNTLRNRQYSRNTYMGLNGG